MNFKKIIAYNVIRGQLTAEELVLAGALYAASDSERELLVESLQPEATTKKKPAATTRKGGCAVCDYTKPSPIHHKTTMTGYHVYQPAKSQRASNVAATLNRNLAQQRQDAKCAHVFDNSETCFARPSDAIHNSRGGYSSYHEFVAPSAQTAGAGD